MKEFLKSFGSGQAAPMAGNLVEKPTPGDALIERTDDCPIPEAVDRLLERTLAGTKTTLFLQDKDFRFVWVANMHPLLQDVRFLGNTDITSGLHEAIYTKYLPVKQEVLRSGKAIHFDEWEVLPDGNSLFLSIAYEPYSFPDGSVGVFSRLIDYSAVIGSDDKVQTLGRILDEKAHELKELDERILMALEEMPLLFYIQDENLNYVWVRNFVAQYNSDTLIGKKPNETTAMGPGLEEAMKRKQHVIETGIPQKFEMWVDNQDGGRTFLQSSYIPYPLANGKRGLMGKILDLTPQKEAELKLREVNKELQRQNQIIAAQLEEAREMQMAMLPNAHLDAARFRLCADMQTCLQVGGDYYDYLADDTDCALIGLGDATGHGVKSGIIVATVKAIFKQVPAGQNPSAVLEAISAHLTAMRFKQAYMGLALLQIRNQEASYAAAGMPPMLVYRRATGQVDTVSTDSIYLGTGYHGMGTYREVRLAYQPGDIAVLLSDGYSEMRDARGQFVRMEALATVLTGSAWKGCDAIVAAYKAWQVEVLAGRPLYDDATVVAIEFK